jgi:hypothetical protein
LCFSHKCCVVLVPRLDVKYRLHNDKSFAECGWLGSMLTVSQLALVESNR